MDEYGCNCSFDSDGNPVDWCSFHEALRDSLAEKDKEIERLQTNINFMKRALRWSEWEEDGDG